RSDVGRSTLPGWRRPDRGKPARTGSPDLQALHEIANSEAPEPPLQAVPEPVEAAARAARQVPQRFRTMTYRETIGSMSPGAEADSPRTTLSGAARAGWTIYHQVAAILAAFSLIAVIDHWWHIGWRGFLHAAIGLWDFTIRPAVQRAFHVIVTIP